MTCVFVEQRIPSYHDQRMMSENLCGSKKIYFCVCPSSHQMISPESNKLIQNRDSVKFTQLPTQITAFLENANISVFHCRKFTKI